MPPNTLNVAEAEDTGRAAVNNGCGMADVVDVGVGGWLSESSSSMLQDAVANLSGLLGALFLSDVANNPAPSGPAFKLRLCPGTRRIGLSSSTNLSRAVALATPQAGVGLSLAGDDPSGESSIISIPPRFKFLWPNGDPPAVDLSGEIMTKSSSC